jgi:thiopeptide-type bacteriocin biosynthesis protein
MRVRVPFLLLSYTHAARNLALHAALLQYDGVLADYTLNTYRPETRYGTGEALAAAEAAFAADSHAVLQHQRGDRQAATAAGMIAIAHAFSDDGPRWLADHIPTAPVLAWITPNSPPPATTTATSATSTR